MNTPMPSPSSSPARAPLGILMLGGAKRLTMARHLARAAAAHGMEARFTSYELHCDEPVGAVAAIVEGLRWDDPGVIADIERVMAARGIHILLPFVDGAIEIAAVIAGRNPGVYVPVCSPSMARALYDKVLSADLFESHGIAVPATWRPGAGPVFPLIAKPRRGSASAGIRILRDADDLGALTDPSAYLIQEYVGGAEEYTVDCFISADGSASVFSPRRRLATLGGEVTRTVTVDIPGLTAGARATAAALGLRGAFTIQYLRRDSRLLLMEINPRLGGGATASIAAGADIAAMIVEDAAGLPISPREARPGIVTARCFQDVSFIDSHTVINI